MEAIIAEKEHELHMRQDALNEERDRTYAELDEAKKHMNDEQFEAKR